MAVEQAADKWPVREDILAEIVRRDVEVAQPQKIILFGSAARGTLGPNSDLDLLVTKDVVVVSPEDVERYKDCHALVIKPALKEGKVIYAR